MGGWDYDDWIGDVLDCTIPCPLPLRGQPISSCPRHSRVSLFSGVDWVFDILLTVSDST